MKKIKIKNIPKSKGYVSIETLIVAGLIIASGSFMVSKLAYKGKDISVKSNNSLNLSKKVLDDNNYNNNKTQINVEKNKKNDIEGDVCTLANPSDLKDYEFRELNVNNIPEIIITKYKGDKKDIEIPSCINGKRVAFIGRRAFYRKDLTSVKLPNGLKKIDDFAFSKNKLKTISIPGTVKKIGLSAFEENELTEVNLNEGISVIMSKAFSYNKLTKINLPENIKHLDGFSYNQLTKIVLPKNLEELGEEAFENNQIVDVKLPEGLKVLGGFCENQLVNINIPNSVEKITGRAFEGNKLNEVFIPDNVIRIECKAFACNNISKITGCKNLEKIDVIAFRSNKLNEVTLPKFTRYEIGDTSPASFDDNVKVKRNQLDIPDYLYENVGNNEIRITKYKGLDTNVVVPKQIEGKTVVELGDKSFCERFITSIKLPDTVKTIGKEALAFNSIESIDLPNNLKKIDSNAFSFNSIKTITLPKGIEEINSNAFSNNRMKTINVYKDSKYKIVYDDEVDKTFNNLSKITKIIN